MTETVPTPYKNNLLKKDYRPTTQRKKREYQNELREELSTMDSNDRQEDWKYGDRVNEKQLNYSS